MLCNVHGFWSSMWPILIITSIVCSSHQYDLLSTISKNFCSTSASVFARLTKVKWNDTVLISLFVIFPKSFLADTFWIEGLWECFSNLYLKATLYLKLNNKGFVTSIAFALCVKHEQTLTLIILNSLGSSEGGQIYFSAGNKICQK